MSFPSVWKVLREYFALGRDNFIIYSTLGKETNFTKSIFWAVLSLGATVAGFQTFLRSPALSEPGIAVLSVVSIVIFLLLIIRYTAKSAERTTEPEFHTTKGQFKVIVSYLLIGIVAVLLVYGIGVLTITDLVFLDLGIVDILFGTGLVFLFTLAAALANYSTITEKYLSLREVLTTFAEESNEKLSRIDNEIDGIGHIPRSETSRILESIEDPEDLDNSIIKGRGGVGKSGILKRVYEECNYEILFIDASAHARITSGSDIFDDLEPTLERCIHQVSSNRTLVVMFDQLDDTTRESGEVYSEIIDSVAQLSRVGVIFACRTYELDNYDEFQDLTVSGHFDNEIEVNTLSETQAEDHLEELGITSPTQDLIELCEEIEYLDVIGTLVAEGSDLEDVTEQVAVWEEYRELLAEDHPSDGQRRGDQVIDRAVEHAIETTESGNSVFGVDEILWTDRELISMGAIRRVTESGRDRVFRFRHRQFQLYLYAWQSVNRTVNDKHLFQDVINDLSENISNDVVKWMFAVYTDREEELPEGADDFLEEVLDVEDGFQFYWASKILDVVKRWDASVNTSVTETVLEKLESREKLYNYFFDKETDTSWMQALADIGRFQNPPRHLLAYLHEVASLHPEEVSSVIREDTSGLDRSEQALVVSIIQELPLEYRVDLYDIVKDSLDQLEPRLDMYYSRSAELAEDLVNGEHFDEGLDLIDSLLTIRLEAEPEGRNEEIMGSYYLTSLFDEGTLERLVRNRPNQTIELFEEKLNDAARARAEDRGKEVDDLQFFHQFAVSNFSIEEDDRNKPFELFVGFLRETVDTWFETTDVEDQQEKITEYLDSNVILRGFGFYLVRKHSEDHSDLVGEELLDEENYRDIRLKKEFNLLLKHGFSSIPDDRQQEVVDVITSVPVRDTFERIAENRQDEFDDMTVEELVERRSDRWIRDRLWPIREHLSEEADEQLSELIDQFEDEPEDPETPAVRGGFVSHESPESRSELEEYSPSELIDFCIEEPFEEQEWYETAQQESGRTGSVEEIGRQGAAEEIADIILDNPGRYATEIPRLQQAPASYSTRLIGHLRDRMEDESDILENQEFREALWELSESIVSDTEEWPKQTRKRIGWLLRDGFGNADLYNYFLREKDRVREITITLADDPDPDISTDRPPEGYAGHNDPSHTALNTVRPVAVDALIIYARRVAVDEDSEPDSKVIEKLEERMDDISLGVHSVFGRRLLTLWPIDEDWVIDHLPEIFPRSQSQKDTERFTAAWDSYVAFSQTHPDVFPHLRKYYFHAIDLMAEGETTETINADQQMAGHLLGNYLFEYDLEEWSESLLAYLYDRADPDLARQVAWNLWKWGDEQEEDDAYDKWDKTRALWERRVKQVGDDDTYSDEITWFVRYLDHIGSRVELCEIENLLRNSIFHIGSHQHSRRVWSNLEEYLSRQSADHTEIAVEVFHRLVTNYERPFGQDFNDNVEAILHPAFEEFETGDEVYTKAFETAQSYASEGDNQAQTFLDNNH
ncbi:hypothetical protein [Halobacterium salinarum]|uniref:hypothetical protein n=1 Tax=Halobacterium salinarum TaxID=2242 RepID=UPI0025579CB2|nr:hypothetical protein [Halobacterium salinarum]MDL0128053.1 hypothetical protein [Halobacterium salinarum]